MRAGLTCVKFFTGDSGGSTAVSECTTISDLHGRLHYLDRAGQHFKTALNKGGMDPASESEVRGHLDVIALQKEVSIGVGCDWAKCISFNFASNKDAKFILFR